MSKFDTKAARKDIQNGRLGAFQPQLQHACDHIDALEARIAKLTKAMLHVVECDRAIGDVCTQQHYRDLQVFPGDSSMVQYLVEALAACDDGEGMRCDEPNAGSTGGAAGTAKRSPKPERREP